MSTNSITQGEQVGVLWGWLLAQGVKIHFAHRTFSWSNEARGVAAVHCVIIGFGLSDRINKVIYDYRDIRGEPQAIPAKHINPYLVDAPDVLLPRRSQPISGAPAMQSGNKPIDGGNYLFIPQEKAEFLAREPQAAPYFRRWLGGDEFLNGIERWYLWLGDCSPEQLRTMPESLRRVEAVRIYRKASKSAPTRKLFHTEFIPTARYIALPEVSSERRNYIPVAFVGPEVLCSNKLRVLESAGRFHFGVLTSQMHMAWTRYVTGRLKSDFQYSALIVYNNFPWPTDVSDAQRAAIESAAQAVLDARAAHPDATLADLYDPLTMPANLLKAHQALDRAVDAAYGRKGFASDAERVAFLFEQYRKLTSLLPPESTKLARRKSRRKVDSTDASVEPG